MWPNPALPAEEEIFNGKLYFLCSVSDIKMFVSFFQWHFDDNE